MKHTRIAGTPYDARQADQVQELARNYQLACRIRGVARKAADLPTVWNVDAALGANHRAVRAPTTSKHPSKDPSSLVPSSSTSSSLPITT